jgi:type IV pilus assembly protein PilB
MLTSAQFRDIVLKSGFVSPEDFDAAVKSSQELGKDIGDVLVYRGLLGEDMIGKLIAEYYHVPFVDLSHKTIPLEVLSIIPEEAAATFHVIPFLLNGSKLSLAMEDPSDLEAREFVKRKTGYTLDVYYARNNDIIRALGQYKRNIKDVFTKIIHENINASNATGDVAKLAEDLPIIRILDTVLEYAVAEGASDVHFEELEEVFLVRFRIDGILRDIVELPKNIHAGIVARIKILSLLKIDEHRIPQDGRFKFKLKETYIALRVSILPAFYGENVVLRLLAESARPLSFEELGLSGHNLNLLKKNITKPHGMILVTGPTGSGKTTTLYSILTMLNTTEVKICTVEDPVEYGIKRVNQTQINPLAGLTFAAGLRALLRHDPDIIMVGEIRDEETAEMAIHSSLTGHLVLSTLHTNDAAGAIPRFLDMGAEGFLLASTINLVVAQRLVRKLCPRCIKSITIPAETVHLLREMTGEREISQTFYKSSGCEECGMRGYKGRIGIFEILEITEEMRNLIVKRGSTDEIVKLAMANGMVSLVRDGINKASGGLTSIEEVLRVVRE